MGIYSTTDTLSAWVPVSNRAERSSTTTDRPMSGSGQDWHNNGTSPPPPSTQSQESERIGQLLLPGAQLNPVYHSLHTWSPELAQPKGTVSRDFRPLFFFHKKLQIGPHMNRKNCFTNFFVFVKIFDCKIRKSRKRSRWLRKHFSSGERIFIFLNNCYWVCKHTHVPFFTSLFL